MKKVLENELKKNEAVKTQDVAVQTNDENINEYPELGFLEVLIYASIPHLYGLPLLYIAGRDLLNGKEPFHGATNPITKGFAYLVTLGITGPMYLVHKLVGEEKLIKFRNNLVTGIKDFWNRLCGKTDKEPVIDMEPVVEIERPKLLKNKSLSLSDVDKYFQKSVDCDSIKNQPKQTIDIKDRRINSVENLLNKPKSNGLNLQF